LKKNQIKIGAILSYIALAVTNIVGLVYTPFMVRIMGQSEYGLYSLVSSIVAYLSILDLGLGNAIVVYVAKSIAKGDKKEEKKLNGMFIIVYSIIGIIVLVAGLILYFNIDNMFQNTMSVEELVKAKIMVMLLVINLAVSFPMGVFGSILTAYEEFIVPKIITIVRSILMPCIMLPLLLMGYRSITMVVVNVTLNILCLIFNMIYCFKKCKIQFNFKGFDMNLIKEIFKYSFFIFLSIIIDKINWNVDQLILGSVSGTVAVAVYGVASQFNNIYLGFSTAISGVLLPKITKMVQAKASDQEISEEFVKTGRIQYLIMALIITGFLLFGKEFIMMLFGNEYEASYYIACILMVPVTIPLIQNVGVNILQAKEKHKFRTIIYLIIAILNILVSIPLAKAYGGLGTAIGTAISLILGNGIIINWYYHSKIHIDIPAFWKQILKMSVPVLLIFGAGYILRTAIIPNRFIILLAEIVCYSLVYIFIMWNFAMNQYEKELVRTPIRKILRKKKEEGL